MKVLLVLLAFALPPAAGAAGGLPLDAVQRRFISEVLASVPRLDAVWPGFALPKDCVLVHFPRGGSLLIGRRGRAPGFAPLDPAQGRSLGAGGEPLAFRAGGASPITTDFAPDYDLGGARAFVLVYDEARSLREQLILLHHESFHELQARAFTRGAPTQGRHPPESPELSAMRRVEGQLLLRALTDPERWTELARSFVAVRERRYAAAPAGTREWEAAFERHEGVAEYAGLRAAFPSVTEPDAASLALAPNLATPLFESDSEGTMSFYGTGAAMALLLDRMRAPWKPRVASGVSLLEVLEEAFPPADGPSRAARALDEAGWGSLAAWERARAGERRQGGIETAADFEAGTGMRLIVRSWETRGVSGFSTTGGAPRSIPGGTLYPSLTAAELTGITGFHAAFRDTSVLQRSGKEARASGRMSQVYPTEFVAILGESPAIELELDGRRRVSVPSDAAFSRLVLKTRNVTLEAKRKGRVRMQDSVLTVELEPVVHDRR